MLYSLTLAVIGLSFLMPAMCFIAFRKGYEVGKGKEPKTNPPKLPVFRKPKEDPQIKKLNAVWDNVDVYNGGPEGQRAVR